MRSLSDNWSYITDLLEASNRAIVEIVNRKQDAMASVIRTKVVIPYCEKHRLVFTAGMGTWVFFDTKTSQQFNPGTDRREKPGRPDTTEGDADEWFTEPTEEDTKLVEILDYCFSNYRFAIGSMMEDYTPKSI